ncbi:MAG: hypothetical protein WD070_09650 [Pirellulaceae bacterium]
MWRTFFATIGVALLILGAECLVVEKAVLASSPQKPAAVPMSPFDEPQAPRPPANRELRPPEWAPWSLLSAGAVILLYTFTVKRDGG